jgi:flagellar biosynthesis protein FliQ
MSTTMIMSATREMLIFVLVLATPFLLAAILSAIAIGLLQAGTRINDMTLSFVPRFMAVLLMIYFTASWAFGQLTGYVEHSVTAMTAFSG